MILVADLLWPGDERAGDLFDDVSFLAAMVRVEEVWLDDDEARALALRTLDGRHALLRAEDVLAVETEQRWVVVRPEQELLELDAPRLRSFNGTIEASWGTTGALVRAASEPRWHIVHLPHRRPHGARRRYRPD